MARRGRTSARQRVADEAARRAAAAVRLAQTRPPRPRQHPEPCGAVVGLPAPARAPERMRADNVVPVSVCAAGCQVCAEAAGRFDALRAASLVQRRRFDEPDRYPYASGKHTLHRSSCREVEQSVGHIEGDDSVRVHGALTRFAHDGLLDSGWATLMHMMNPGEAAAWVTERIGPRGGIRYRLCRICTPALPQS